MHQNHLTFMNLNAPSTISSKIPTKNCSLEQLSTPMRNVTHFYQKLVVPKQTNISKDRNFEKEH